MKRMNEQSIPLLVVAGPTASGKTSLAVALAKALGGEVVSADSMQIYSDMQIATARPSEEEMDSVPHHLMGFADPSNTDFSVADYAKLAHACIADIHARGKLPILAGGTGLYIGAVVDNINYTPMQGDPHLRAELALLAQERGGAHLLEMLQALDPETASQLHENNLGRIIRAIEVTRVTGIPMSEHRKRSRLVPSPYRACMLGLCFEDRARLYARCDARVDDMLARGLLEEARQVRARYGGTARQAIGYKELEPYFTGDLPLSDCVENLKRATRRYAKRQLTWFRADTRIRWLTVDHFDSAQALMGGALNIIHNSQIL